MPPALGLTAIACPGHCQSDVVYVGADYAVTGDTLLHNIFQTPLLDIDLESGGRFSNYRAYCRSVVRLASLQGKVALPGHRQVIDDVREIIRLYVGKLLKRVELLQREKESSVARLLDRLAGRGKTDVFSTFLKASEIVFMQDLLDEPARLKEALAQIGLFDEVATSYQRVSAPHGR
ncbi:MAG: hypothetical protein ACK5PS_19990 [Desulfopila sp.]